MPKQSTAITPWTRPPTAATPTGSCGDEMDGRRTGIWRKTVIAGVVDLAYEIGVTPSHLSRVLHGERRPGIRLRAALAARGIDVGPLARRERHNQQKEQEK